MFSVHVDTGRTWEAVSVRCGSHFLGCAHAAIGPPSSCIPTASFVGERPRGPTHTRWRHERGWTCVPPGSLSRLMRQVRPDIVHARDRQGVGMTALALSLGSTALQTRFVAEAPVDSHLERNAFSRWQHRQVQCFVCTSAFTRSVPAQDGAPADRTAIIHEGVDFDHIGAAPRVNLHKEFWLPHGAPLVGSISDLVPHAGQRYLIDAAPLVVRRVPDAHFLIVGDGELDAMPRHQIKHLNLEKHVLLSESRPDELSLLKGVDLFVSSAVANSPTGGILDAMACGRPVVATRAGGQLKVVSHGKTGLLVPTRDAAALADAIITLLEHPNRCTEYSRQAIDRVRQHLSVNRLIDATEAAYQRVVDTPRAADSPGPPSAD